MKTIIQTPTNNLQESIDFYQKLNFKLLSASTPTLLTDGKVVIEINPDRFARAGVKAYKEDWSKELKALKSLTAITKIEGGHLLSDYTGSWIYLMESNLDLNFQPAEKSFGLTGNYAGMSLETTDMARSAQIWKALGYEKTMGDEEKGWVVFSNGSGVDVSLMQPNTCPHLFFNPSLTYFNSGNNLENIKNIRAAGIPITEEITHFNKEGIADNIIIRDPGGLGFFIFND